MIACQFDELSVDTLRNRLVRGALAGIASLVPFGNEVHNAPVQLAGASDDDPAVAAVRYTISSDYFEATNTGVQLGNSNLAATLIERVVAAAEKLQVKYVISPECGHAYTTIRWDAPNIIGRPLPFKVVHVMELLGHRDIKTTLIYTQFISFESDDYHSAVAAETEKARQLIDAEFDYGCTYNDTLLFRKRK